MIKKLFVIKIVKFIFVLIGILVSGCFDTYADEGVREISGHRFDESIIVAGNRFKLETAGLLR